ncbi:MAG TPA: DUF4190 domain-containing protein [Planctomycetota bacterium]|nr:DUF4190 domain-containing protein [Planctomycetota bacterium]
MDIQFRCPCGAVMSSPEEKVGSRTVCAQCGRLLIVPGVPVAAGISDTQQEKEEMLEAEEVDEPDSLDEMQEVVEAKSTMSGMAVASLVLGLVGPFLGVLAILAGILALVFGGLAVRSISRTRFVRGKGAAVAGMVLGAIDILLGLTLLVALYNTNQPDDSMHVVLFIRTLLSFIQGGA